MSEEKKLSIGAHLLSEPDIRLGQFYQQDANESTKYFSSLLRGGHAPFLLLSYRVSGGLPRHPSEGWSMKGSEYMPRTKIFRDKYAAEDFAKALNIGLARTGIKGYQAAEKIGVTAATLCNRRNDPDGFRLKEVRLLYRAGILTEQDIMTYLKGGAG